MKTRAKFECFSKERTGDEGFEIKLQVVYDGSIENEAFFDLTPYGDIVVGTVNLNAAEIFEVGQEYYVDFTKVEK